MCENGLVPDCGSLWGAEYGSCDHWNIGTWFVNSDSFWKSERLVLWKQDRVFQPLWIEFKKLFFLRFLSWSCSWFFLNKRRWKSREDLWGDSTYSPGIVPTGIRPPPQPKSRRVVLFYDTHVRPNNHKIFLKAPSPPIYTNFEGERAPKKGNFLVYFFHEMPKNGILTCFFLFARGAKVLVKIRSYESSGSARNINFVDLKKRSTRSKLGSNSMSASFSEKVTPFFSTLVNLNPNDGWKSSNTIPHPGWPKLLIIQFPFMKNFLSYNSIQCHTYRTLYEISMINIFPYMKIVW